jgi:hypothetical protein
MTPIDNNAPPASSADATLNTIIQDAQPPKQPGTFRRILGTVVGMAANVFAPGLGGLVGNLTGGLGGANSASTDPTQFLRLQQQMQSQSEAFQTVSNVLKSKHDSSMNAISNVKS